MNYLCRCHVAIVLGTRRKYKTGDNGFTLSCMLMGHVMLKDSLMPVWDGMYQVNWKSILSEKMLNRFGASTYTEILAFARVKD